MPFEPRRCAIETCRQPLSIHNKEELCHACQLKEREGKFGSAKPLTFSVRPSTDEPVIPQELCRFGCGKLRHRGRCVARTPKPPPPAPSKAPIPETGILTEEPRVWKGRFSLDRLTSTTIDVTLVPRPVKAKRVSGRSGLLWERLRKLPDGKAEKVANRDRRHAMTTMRMMRDKARQAKRSNEFQFSVDDEHNAYFWWEEPPAQDRLE